MSRTNVLVGVLALLLVLASSAYAGKTEQSTIYPSPYGEYKNLFSPGTSCFAVTPGYNVGIGTASPTDIAVTVNAADLTITGSIVQEAWQTPTYSGSWAYYGAPFNPIGYFRDKEGIVHLRGMIKDAAYELLITTLPAGYRPSQEKLFFVICANPGYAVCRVDVRTDGVITNNTGTAMSWLSLDGLTFRASGY